MTKHSPLPFRTVEHSWQQTSIYDAENKFVATLTISDECDDDSQEEYEAIMDGNAALIVEAVNTHAAQKEAVRELVECLELIMGNSTNFRLKAPEYMVDKIDAALAKHKQGE